MIVFNYSLVLTMEKLKVTFLLHSINPMNNKTVFLDIDL